jgi:DNA-binding MarR family transcriptional regulator
MNKDILKLENQLCFPLYACAKEVVRQYKPYLDEIGLTYTKYIVMMVLWEEKSMNIKTLGNHLYLDSGTLTPLIKKMEAQGLVTRQRSFEDERNLIVTITQKGDELKEEAMKVPEKIGKCINITSEEADTLYKLLYKVLGQMS